MNPKASDHQPHLVLLLSVAQGLSETYREHLAFFEGALGNDLILSGVNLVDQRCCINVTQLDPTARSSKCNHTMKYPLKRNEEIET